MTSYIVGLRHKTRSKVLTIEAEDALVAALRAKHENLEAVITYVRKSNRRGMAWTCECVSVTDMKIEIIKVLNRYNFDWRAYVEVPLIIAHGQ
jgi:hypothetical protein